VFLYYAHRAVILGSAVALMAQGAARDEQLTPEDRIELTREMTSEYATAKDVLPRSRDALPMDLEGAKDEDVWAKAFNNWGTAADVGDLVQVTKIEFDKKRIVLEINGGFKGGKKWWQRIQVTAGPMSTGGAPSTQQTANPVGTKLSLVFPEELPRLSTAQLKEYLSPIMDFEQRTASEQYVETLPEPIRAAIEEERAIEGMDRDAVMLAMGRPLRKVRELNEQGEEIEDWQYGEPPGIITFVRFEGNEVVEVRESYAGVGGTVAPPLEPK